MLNARQFEILRLVADGLCYKEIGVKLNIVVRTVKYHMCGIYKELGIREARSKGSGIDAVVWWAKNGAPDTWAEYVKAASKAEKIPRSKVVEMRKRQTA